MSHPNLVTIAESNKALIEKIGFNPEVDDPFELDNPETLRASGLFPEHAIDRMFPGDVMPEPLMPLPTTSPEVPNSVGMVLVRPDMLHISPEIERFLARYYKILEVHDQHVSPEQYWAMYEHVITSAERTYSRLTRAAVYLSMPAKLIVFDRMASDADGISATEDLLNIKGKQGIEAPGTLRGDLVYNEAIKLGFHTLQSVQATEVADPFGAYRKMMREGVNGPHLRLKYPMLFYTAVGIHSPDAEEIQRDLKLFDPTGESFHEVSLREANS